MYNETRFDIEDFNKNPDNYYVIVDDYLGFCVMSKRCNIDHILKTLAGYRAGYMGQGVDYTLKRYGAAWKEQLIHGYSLRKAKNES